MGFIRGGLLFFVGVIFLLSLIIGNGLHIASSALEYDNLKDNIKPVISDAISKEVDVSGIEKNFDEIKKYCEEQNSDFSVIEEGQDFEIDCELILSSTPENFLDNQIDKFIEKNYYKEYDCGFIDCFKESNIPFFLISEQTKNYVKGKYYLFLGIALAFAVVIFLLVADKRNFLVLTGVLMIVSSLPFMFLKNFSMENGISSQVFLIFMGPARAVFWWMFIIGLVVGGLGIGLRFWSFEEMKGMLSKKGKKK